MSVKLSLLRRDDDRTSEAVVGLLRGLPQFHALSQSEGADIVRRDAEDATKLAAGIHLAIAKGVLPVIEPAEVKRLSVVGKTADEVAAELVAALGPVRVDGGGKSIVLQGLSGTGKGTTTKKLLQLLPRCISWSNGNVFRAATWLVNQELASKGVEFNSDALTPELLRFVFGRLSFQAVAGTSDFDVFIDGTQRVSAIANTDLKLPIVSTRVPTVAELTQGEVIAFAKTAVQTLTDAGFNVLLEGRAQTLNYIPTPYRFELVIEDVAVLGERRAAQRVVATCLAALKSQPDEEYVADEDLARACQALA